MSDTNEQVRPALTVEEWAAELAQRPTPLVPSIEWAAREMGDISRHALAALALYGQPFGFDATDLAQLRVAAAILREGDNGGHAHFVDRIADKIAALLPPEGR